MLIVISVLGGGVDWRPGVEEEVREDEEVMMVAAVDAQQRDTNPAS